MQLISKEPVHLGSDPSFTRYHPCKHPAVLSHFLPPNVHNSLLQHMVLRLLSNLPSLISTGSPTYSTCRASCMPAQQEQKIQTKTSHVQVQQVPWGNPCWLRTRWRCRTTITNSRTWKSTANASRRIMAPTGEGSEGSEGAMNEMKTLGSLEST